MTLPKFIKSDAVEECRGLHDLSVLSIEKPRVSILVRLDVFRGSGSVYEDDSGMVSPILPKVPTRIRTQGLA